MLDSGKVGNQFSFLPLSNNTVRRHIDKICNDVQSQLNDILRNTNFSLALLFETSIISNHLFWLLLATNILTKKGATLEICERGNF